MDVWGTQAGGLGGIVYEVGDNMLPTGEWGFRQLNKAQEGILETLRERKKDKQESHAGLCPAQVQGWP